MRLRVLISPSSPHSEAVTGVVWVGPDEAISAADDHRICRWTVAKMEAALVPNQPKDPIFPTSLHLPSSSSTSARLSSDQSSAGLSALRSGPKQHNQRSSTQNELILMTASDGKIHQLNIGGKIERSIEAHQGAAILARWSNADPGGAGGFVSCGEDGTVKMWSRNGMLRSVLAQLGKPVYAVDWNGDSTKLVYCCGEECHIKQLKAQTAPIKWRAHTGLVLCLSWSALTDHIVSGGEDCRYRLWDGQGRPLWSSGPHGHPVSSLAWGPNGEMFAVGSYNMIRLCDKSGWSQSMERPNSGSIYAISWSPDGTQLLGGCANGQLIHAHIVERRLMWEQLEAVQTRRRQINIRDMSSEVARERLETRDRVIRLELGFNFLVVATTKQCYIFRFVQVRLPSSSSTFGDPFTEQTAAIANDLVALRDRAQHSLIHLNWNTPVVTDLKEGAGIVSLIRLCGKCFMLVDSSSVQVWNYEGRILSSIRLPSSSSTFGDPFTEQTAAIANDLVALRDRAQHSLIHLFDPQSGRTTGDGPITHNSDIRELGLNMRGGLTNRRVAFVDLNDDCFLALVNCYGSTQRVAKIGSLIACLAPNNATNMLAAIQDNQRLLVWTLPTVAFVDRDLLLATQLELGNSAELGKSSTIIGFIGNTVTIRRSDGCLIAHYLPPFVSALIRCAQQNQWDKAVRICRTLGEEFLWATLAGLAASEKNYTVAEICYGQLQEVEKVLFLGELRAQPNPQLRSAMTAQFGGQRREADAALVNAGRHFQAIMLNLGMFRFDRALELALKTGTHLDTVLGYRQRYLELIGRKETDPKYLRHLSQVEVDWLHIFEKIQQDETKAEQHQ